jgi:hypothetical protein
VSSVVDSSPCADYTSLNVVLEALLAHALIVYMHAFCDNIRKVEAGWESYIVQWGKLRAFAHGVDRCQQPRWIDLGERGISSGSPGFGGGIIMVGLVWACFNVSWLTQWFVQIPVIVLTCSATKLGSAGVPVDGTALFQSPPSTTRAKHSSLLLRMVNVQTSARMSANAALSVARS